MTIEPLFDWDFLAPTKPIVLPPPIAPPLHDPSNDDLLMDSEQRAMTGAFFTPPIWVNKAHSVIGEVLGSTWKNDYVVWDSSCGTGNLTRDFTFKELYLSTLEEGDVKAIKDRKFNQGCTLFQYDFLGEVGIGGVPANLKKAFACGKKVLFLINPPYSAATVMGVEEGASRAGIATTAVRSHMHANGHGRASSQLYIQFMYKIAKLKEEYPGVALAMFSPTLFMTGHKFEEFGKYWCKVMHFVKGGQFNASHFKGLSNQWGVGFTIWT